MNQLRDLFNKIDSLNNIPSISISQDQFEQNMKEFKMALKRTQTLLSDLEYLSKEGQKLAERGTITIELIPVRVNTF